MRERSLSGLSLLYLGALSLTGTVLVAQMSPISSRHAAEVSQPADIAANSAPVVSGDATGAHGNAGVVRQPSAQVDSIRIQEALDALNNLRRQYRNAGDRKAEANVLGAIANSENALHQRQRSVEDLQAALDIWRELGDKGREALTLAHVGDVYRGWGFLQQASHFYRDALAIYPETDKRGRAATLNNLGLTYFSLRDKKKCLETLNQALASFRSLGDRHGEALALSNLGTTYNFLANDPQKALDMFQEAVTKLELLDDRSSEANALDNMGEVWLNLHKPEMASLSFQRAIVLYQRIGDAQGEASARKHMDALGEPVTIASRH